ncbi:MAG: hypothetical protein MUE46_21035 [Xanthomonadales bacterium]|jgi:hypothetical protein|nr:hypothetical protein [Xanthomonadales bacterium]
MKTRNCSKLAMLALCASLAPAAMAQVSRTPWQMHQGAEGVITGLTLSNPTAETLPAMFDRANIPADGAGWGPAPNPDSIGFGSDSASQIDEAGGTCLKALDYTYFQTMVNVPPGTNVDEFKIIFTGMDDASRITVFNANHPGGLVVDGSYVTRVQATAGTADLAALMAAGQNRVVITQVDWCPVGNKLQSAKVELNGSTIAAAPVDSMPVADSGAPATIFEHIDFMGNSQALVEGMNTGPLALGNDVASSIQVARCWRVTLYEHARGRGRELVLTADDSDLRDDNFNDIVSNVLVERDPNCGG